MKRIFPLCLTVVASLACARNAPAQGIVDEEAAADSTDSWHYQTQPQPALTPRMIIQQKAQMRAYQRIARLESMKWYGMSASRPRASGTPFMGTPSPVWQMPGGMPSAWVPYRAPTVVLLR